MTIATFNPGSSKWLYISNVNSLRVFYDSHLAINLIHFLLALNHDNITIYVYSSNTFIDPLFFCGVSLLHSYCLQVSKVEGCDSRLATESRLHPTPWYLSYVAGREEENNRVLNNRVLLVAWGLFMFVPSVSYSSHKQLDRKFEV
jgi:hypothetical protein